MPVRSFTDAEILVSERKRLERPLVVMIWLGIVLFSLAENSVYFLLAGTLAAGIKLQSVSRGKEFLLRRSLVNVGVLLATIVAVAALALHGRDPRIELAHYAILIQLCKLFERARNRDYVQIAALSLLTVMTACLFKYEMWFTLSVLAYLALASYTLMVLTLKRGLDAAAEACLVTESAPLPAHKVAWNVRRDWPTRSLRKTLVVVFLFMAGVGALFFLVAPRSGPGAVRSTALTGYAEEVELGNAKVVYLSEETALKVRISPDPAAPPFAAPVYLRGHVMETYSHNHWSSPANRWQTYLSPTAEEAPEPQPPGTVRQEINAAGRLLPTLFGVHPAAQFRIEDGLGWPKRSPAGEIRLDLPPRAVAPEWVSYTVDSWPDPRAELEDRQMVADGPPDDEGGMIDVAPAVARLAKEWCGDLRQQRDGNGPGGERAGPARREELDKAIADRIAHKLFSEYRYSLNLSDCDANMDGVEDFLIYMRQGHCEYFASAMTVLCHELGLRARLATGFRLDEFTPGQWANVRDCDAHAWTEVWLPSAGWVVYDPTPGGGYEAPRKPWWSFFTDFRDDMQAWYLRAILYSEEDRMRLGGSVKGFFQRIWGAITSTADDLWEGIKNLIAGDAVNNAVVAVAIGLAVLAGLVEALVVLSIVRRRSQIARALRRSAGARWRQVLFLATLLKMLDRRGLGPRPDRTVLETLSTAADALALPADQARRFAQLYYRLRWGREDLLPQEVQAAEEAVTEWRNALAKRKRAP